MTVGKKVFSASPTSYHDPSAELIYRLMFGVQTTTILTPGYFIVNTQILWRLITYDHHAPVQVTFVNSKNCCLPNMNTVPCQNIIQNSCCLYCIVFKVWECPVDNLFALIGTPTDSMDSNGGGCDNEWRICFLTSVSQWWIVDLAPFWVLDQKIEVFYRI